MPVSLETQEIMIAFAIDNKDNYASWGKYELDELQFAYDEMPEADRNALKKELTNWHQEKITCRISSRKSLLNTRLMITNRNKQQNNHQNTHQNNPPAKQNRKHHTLSAPS